MEQKSLEKARLDSRPNMPFEYSVDTAYALLVDIATGTREALMDLAEPISSPTPTPRDVAPKPTNIFLTPHNKAENQRKRRSTIQPYRLPTRHSLFDHSKTPPEAPSEWPSSRTRVDSADASLMHPLLSPAFRSHSIQVEASGFTLGYPGLCCRMKRQQGGSK
eukprot:CAMPEP_0171679068 /NCGR_PEP_ID=MMETSP0990-20121206/56032_1 /TAXON_ID=483369 /ORGANISM="non described non described, Strain CCMP2098" /LENGTH=162 /DNA_ID=CAMNT_0012265813 /DNA_START=66 /DNA_END=555 /DNA_ORIENTATION=+